MAEQITSGQALLAESDYLKSEQRQRIRYRDSLTYTTLAAMAAVVAAVLQARNNQLCLLLPPVTIVLGWKYAANDDKITAIGNYIKTNLAPRLAAIVHQPVFVWEIQHGRYTRRRARKAMQITADLLVFCVAPLAALVTVWATTVCPPALWVVSILETILVGITSVFVAAHAKLAQPTLLPKLT
ncbi:hypothetical protein JOF56_011016 [Kibdelosporangium banguiense]|uniref:Integral membrane protein n=1 Tax=Kibdelosporangium banguiense TaxID=1365924 RepID=A0ABS4U1Z0_9PSEU|nr:hypothetical protein [Kibdelosporangium banguiense]MBP2330631.1 hypothetical protein [Kibdelosporangium banguiense]